MYSTFKHFPVCSANQYKPILYAYDLVSLQKIHHCTISQSVVAKIEKFHWLNFKFKWAARHSCSYRPFLVHAVFYYSLQPIFVIICYFIKPLHFSLERVCTDLSFGAEIQPKHLVFCYLGFLPGFSLVFCCLPHPMDSCFQENKAFLFWRIFFLGFWNPSNCLVFLEGKSLGRSKPATNS